MKTFLDKIADTDFRRPAKRLVIITLAVVLVCGALTAFMFRTQITEIAALKSADSQSESVQVTEAQTGGNEDGRTNEHDGEEADMFDSGLVTRPSAAAVTVGIASIVLCGLCALAYWLTVAAWLYKASANAGMNRALWMILGLLTNLAAVIVFLIIRGQMVRCNSCGTWQKPAQYCAECGAGLRVTCPNCGRICAASADFCPDCGTALQKKNNSEAENA